MSNKLYEEAIADAKKIREVAEENAKKAVLEAVTPKIREFIESQILEQDEKEKKDEEGEDEESYDETVELDESAINMLLGLMGENAKGLNRRSKKAVDLAVNEAFSRLNSNDRNKLYNIANNLSETASRINNKQEKTDMSNEKYYEVDLRALREAVENESRRLFEQDEEEDLDAELIDNMPEEGEDDLLAGMDMEPEMEGPEGDDMISKSLVKQEIDDLIRDLGLEENEEEMPELDMDMEDMGDMEDFGKEEEDDEKEDDEKEKLDEVFEVDPAMLRRELRKIRSQLHESDMGLAGHKGGIAKDMADHFGGKGSANAKKDQFGGKDGSAKGGADFGGGKAGKDVLSEMRRVLRNQRRLNSSLETKLGKYRSAVNTLREQLEELNLFNAKLLYVNKLLQNKQITESQKRSIVKALDEAQNLQEAKVLYKSLTESFSEGRKKSTLNESIRAGGSSRATRSASGNKATTEVDRWAKLAGLKK